MAVENTAFFIGEFMTVSVTERLSPLYEGNGTNTRFDFTFRVFDQEDATGVSVKHKLEADFENVDKSLYTVTLNEDNLGGYVNFLSAPAVGFEFYIVGETPVDQSLDITNYDNFYPEALERALDKLTAILQEWYQLLNSEKESRLSADASFDLLAQMREKELKNYLDNLIADHNGDVSLGTQFITSLGLINDLPELLKWEGRTALVKDEGVYTIENNTWVPVFLKAIYSKFKSTTVHNALNRLKTYSDYGYDKQALGFNDSAFASMFNDSETDNDIFIPGKLSLSGELYGTSNNATLLSLLGNNGNSFKSQIVAGDTKLLSEYAMSEDVLVYSGISGRQALTTFNPTFSNNSIIVNDSVDLSDVKIGSIVKTSDGFWGHISKIENKKLTVINWYRTGVLGVPTGTSATLNHIDKVYLANKVIWCPETYTGSKIVGEEWDFMNSSVTAGERTGLDMVIHDASTKDMDTAHLVRSGKYGVAWLTAFQSQGAKYAGFLNADGVSGQTPSLGGFAEVSTAQVGMYFNGGNALAFKFRYSPSSNVYPTLINTYGFQIKSGNVTKSAVNDQVIDMNAKSYYVNNVSNTFSLVLPDSELVAGQQLEFLLFGDKEVIAKCINQNITVNNLQAYSYIPSVFYKRIIAVWNGSGWYVFS